MYIKKLATDIVKKLNQAGYKAYFAGGWVRDYLMNQPSADIDIATDAPPEVILKLFPHTLLVGLAFGVVIVILEGYQFEVSTFRKDLEYVNGRKPTSIELSNEEEDVKRRDFTINSMFYDPLEEKIYDYVEGRRDLELGLIRTVGDPFERFSEDRLRMIRAIRFSARFNFRLDEATQQAIQEKANTLFPAVAIERVWKEFVKMAGYPHFANALMEMHRLGLLPVIFPSLAHLHLKDLSQYLSPFSKFPTYTPTILYILELFPSFDKQQLQNLCSYLRLSTEETKLATFVQTGKQLLSLAPGLSDPEWVHFYAHSYSQVCLEIFAARLSEDSEEAFYQEHEQNQERLKPHIKRAIKKQPLVTASMLKSLGVLPGKSMGLLLQEAEKNAILHNLQAAEESIKMLQQSKHWPNLN
ncbi:CCA tRNA nucleotidyltransferase [Neochlamydia sp. S13]|uniref:CCA tRNA nucleotidyltransferase n=1 Tax=Neochlamydia sp. S13 TaxID=1353976 RepID=UPI0005AAE7F2|nr:CCA tRNA nucleotidyltransferase [Neochlamydia sp. S13]BBI17753.1 Uncharacterized protein NCS13_1_1558 [Neochlamydia sp. S13]